jgi:DNA-binding NarL/FixJ family response regulator
MDGGVHRRMKDQTVQKDSLTDKQPVLLLVDDDPLITESLGFLLRKNYQVLIADSRDGAIKLLAEADQRPEIALIDLGLPPHPHKPDEGFELIRELLFQSRDVKILVLSVYCQAGRPRAFANTFAASFTFTGN